MTPTCACGRPVKDQARLCQGCTDRLARDLGDIGALAEELTTTRLRQSRTGGQASGVLSRSYERPLPWDERASEASEVLRSTVVAWVRIAVEEGNHRCPSDDMGAMARTLLGALTWIRQQPWADECADEIGHAVQHARKVIDLAPEKVYAGPCREEFEVGEDEIADACCVAELYARRGADVIACRNCGMEHRVDERKRWLVAIANDQLVTAADLSRFLSVYGEPLTAERIRRWASPRKDKDGNPIPAKLLAHGQDRAKRPLYKVSEVVALLAEMPATRKAAS